ncbi:MAG: discoidin domain-containing protein [Dysgonamonadaceae bacterium]
MKIRRLTFTQPIHIQFLIHYIQINLKEPITKCGFDYQNRNNYNGKPMEFRIMVSSDGETWTELAHVDSDLPTTAGSKYSSAFYTASQPFSYFRYVVYKTNSGSSPTFFNMAEFTLFGK